MVNHRFIEHGSKIAVQKFNDCFELLEPLPQRALDIISVLGSDGVASEAVRVAGCCKSNVSYWKNKFVKAGALRLKVDGLVKYYELTSYGSKLLTGSDGSPRLPVVLEDHAVKFKVVQRERITIDWLKLGKPQNWVKLGIHFGSVRVVLNLGVEPSVIIHPGQMKGFNVDELEMDAARVVERVRFVLEEKFGMILNEVGVPLHKPRWRVYRPECQAWILAGTVEVEGLGALDHSPTYDKQDILSGRPHLEYENKRLAENAASFPIAYDGSKRLAQSAVEFPLVLETLNVKLDALYHCVEHLVGINQQLVDAFSKVIGELNVKDEHDGEGKKNLGEYVS